MRIYYLLKVANTTSDVKGVMRKLYAIRHLRDLPAPDIIVIGVATFTIKNTNNSRQGLVKYKEGMKDLLSDIQQAVIKEGSKVLFMVQPLVDEQKLHKAR